MDDSTIANFLIATSLGEGSDDVVRAGVAFARATGAAPWLVHVYLPPAFAPELGDTEAGWIEQQAEAEREALARQARRTGLADLPGFAPAHLCALVGSPPRVIADLARQVKADLIVVGAAEMGRLQRFLLGSTADGVIRNAPCPVLVLRSAACFPPSRVEIPVDLSPVSATALRQGLKMLGAIGASESDTEVLFVLDPDEIERSVQFSREQIERFAGDELRRFVDAHSPRFGVGARRCRVRVGLPREEILAAVTARQADLLILGTHGRSGIERFALGSVATEVMHHAPCNQLIVPPIAVRRTREEELARRDADWSFVSDEVPQGTAH